MHCFWREHTALRFAHHPTQETGFVSPILEVSSVALPWCSYQGPTGGLCPGMLATQVMSCYRPGRVQGLGTYSGHTVKLWWSSDCIAYDNQSVNCNMYGRQAFTAAVRLLAGASGVPCPAGVLYVGWVNGPIFMLAVRSFQSNKRQKNSINSSVPSGVYTQVDQEWPLVSHFLLLFSHSSV